VTESICVCGSVKTEFGALGQFSGWVRQLSLSFSRSVLIGWVLDQFVH